MAKKGNNIYKRKDNRWEGRYIKGYTLAGRIQYGYVYGKSYRETREKQLKAQTALASCQTPPKPGKKTFGDYCDEWLILNRSRVKPATYVKYYNMYRSISNPNERIKSKSESNKLFLPKFFWKVTKANQA